MCIFKAAKAINDELLSEKCNYPNFIPQSLTFLIQLLLEGSANEGHQNSSSSSKIVKSISKIITFTCVKKGGGNTKFRYNTSKGTSHAAKRQKNKII